jgi:hypothetical protein
MSEDLRGRVVVDVSPSDKRDYRVFVNESVIVDKRTWTVSAHAKQGATDSDISPFELVHHSGSKVYTIKIVSATWGLVEGEHIEVQWEGTEQFRIALITDMIPSPTHPPYRLRAGTDLTVTNR